MRTWSELSDSEREQAKYVARSEVLPRCVEFPPEFLCGDSEELTDRYDRAVKEMAQLRTPWFLAERLLEDDLLAQAITEMVDDYCERAYYPEADEPVLYVNFQYLAEVES